MKVLVSDPVHQTGIELLKRKAEVEVATGLSKEELIEKVKDKDALLVRSATKVTREVLEAAEKLKVIGRAGVGVDNIDIKAATEKGIIVVNSPAASSITVAELTMGLMVSLARNIPQASSSLKAGKWEKKRFLGRELRGKTLGIIGMGRIGSEVAKKAQAFELRCVAYDPYISEETARELNVEVEDSIEKVLEQSDFITLHVPLTENTRHLINREAISRMKKGVSIINAARGGIIDEGAVYRALKEGRLAGAAFDVFEREPPEGNPLLELENFIATPHLGASTEEAQRFASTIACEEVLKALAGEPPSNVVNMPRLSPQVMKKLKPYMNLAETLGRFAIQIIEGRIRDTEIVYCGTLTREENREMLTNAALKGVLNTILSEGVNLLSAPAVAKNRNIRVTEGKREDAGRYKNLMVIKVKTNKGEVEVEGFSIGGETRVVGVDGYALQLVPRGRMLVIAQQDKPGVIAKVTSILGENKINIGEMHVGRREKGKLQLMAVFVDQAVGKNILEEISNAEGIDNVFSLDMEE